MLADALARQGFRVTVEHDGQAALRAFDREPFDAVLLDVLLPVLNGYEVARRIKSSPRGESTPVLMLSGIYKTRIHQQEAVERHGAAGFVEKPFKLGQLFGKLEAVLGPRYPQPPPRPAPDAAESVDSEPSERGDFQGRPFPELLAALHKRRATGALLLRRDKVKKIVFFRRGLPESVKSNRLSECLGRVMVRERMISEADCEESLRRMKAEGRQQGTVLIEMGCISPHNLRYALDLQLRLKLLDVFGWTRGEYQFNPHATPPPETVRLEMSPAAIIYEGLRRTFDQKRLDAVLGEVAG